MNSLGTSSRSTKLVHGGVRYLQKAIQELDYEQYKLVVEALHERKIFLDIAPYLSHQLPIMLPVYKYVVEQDPCKRSDGLLLIRFCTNPFFSLFFFSLFQSDGGKYLTIGSAARCTIGLLEVKLLRAVMF